MAREKAISILSNAEKDELLELNGGLINNIQKIAKSEQIKNKQYSGDIKAGSVEVPRFVNAKSEDYGTARTGGKGTALNNKGKVKINLSKHKEIVEEVTRFDLDTKGIPNLIKERIANHTQRMIAELDRAFFAEAETAGTTVSLPAGNAVEKLENLIQTLEIVDNEYVDGVDRELMVISLNPKAYGQVRNFLDTIKNPNIDSSEEEIKLFHGVKVISNHRQTKEAIAMIDGAIAQPVHVYQYDVEKVPLSNDFAMVLFYDYGTKAITPDLIKCVDAL